MPEFQDSLERMPGAAAHEWESRLAVEGLKRGQNPLSIPSSVASFPRRLWQLIRTALLLTYTDLQVPVLHNISHLQLKDRVSICFTLIILQRLYFYFLEREIIVCRRTPEIVTYRWPRCAVVSDV